MRGGKRPRPPWDWIRLALDTAADLLAAAYPVPVRQLLEDILKNVPVEGQGRAVLARARQLLKVRWTHLLDLDCPTVAGLLRDVVKRLQQDEQRQKENLNDLERRLTEALKSKSPEGEDEYDPAGKWRFAVEGKRHAVPFEWKGHPYHFPYAQSLLLEVLVRDPDGEVDYETFNKTGPFVERSDVAVILHVWQPQKRTKKELERYRNNLHQLQKKTNAALKQERLPLRITRPRNTFLRLEKR
jgi:hypothetical protein